MGFLDFLSPDKINASARKKAEEKNSKLKELTLKSPRDILLAGLHTTSGKGSLRDRKFDVFYQVIGFQGIVDGLGCSTIVANTALALSRLGLTVCVVDTSMLSPSQDYLLKTNRVNGTSNDALVDWFSMPVSSKTAVAVSSIDKNVGVLSFKGRTVIDMLSGSDDESLVDFAVLELKKKYDVILVDICKETTQVVAGSIHSCQKIIQVWGDSPHELRNVESFLKNNLTLCCPMDKMKNVVTSKTVDDVKTPWDTLMKRYGFNHIAHVGLSDDIARVNVIGKPLFNYASSSEAIQEFNDCIGDIVCHLLGIDIEGNPTGSITTEDIMVGNVDSTLNKVVNAQVSIGEPEVWRPESLDVNSDDESSEGNENVNSDNSSSLDGGSSTAGFSEGVNE